MELVERITNAIIDGDSELAVSLAKEIVAQKLDLNDVILRGLNRGMQVVGERYEKRQYFLPEIIIAADALYDALAVFQPHLHRDQAPKATVVIGVVRGDIHDIGKNVTKLFLETAGYNVIDCGRNVVGDKFLETVQEHHAQVLALSTLMSPTLESITEVVELLKQRGLREKVLVMIGGAATSEEFAKEIGVSCVKDGYSAVAFLDKHFAGQKRGSS